MEQEESNVLRVKLEPGSTINIVKEKRRLDFWTFLNVALSGAIGSVVGGIIRILFG